MQDKYERLERDCDEGWERKARWERRCGDLEQRVKELEEVEKDYGRVRNVLGDYTVERIVNKEKEKEKVEMGVNKEKIRRINKSSLER